MVVVRVTVFSLRLLIDFNNNSPQVKWGVCLSGQEITIVPGICHGIHRWLRAESYKLDEAEARLRAHAEWRASYVPKGRIDEVRLWHERRPSAQSLLIVSRYEMLRDTIGVTCMCRR